MFVSFVVRRLIWRRAVFWRRLLSSFTILNPTRIPRRLLSSWRWKRSGRLKAEVRMNFDLILMKLATINSMASAASFAAAMESRDDSEIQRTTIDLEFSDTLSFGRKRIDSPLNTSNPLMTSAERERPLTRGERAGRERDASTSLRTTQGILYFLPLSHHSEFSLDILRNIPRIYLNERGRFQCYICQITFPKHDINEYKNHLHKHRTNMVCVFSEKERMVC